MAPLEAVRRLKCLYQMRKALSRDDFKSVVNYLGQYQEWYIHPTEPKTTPSAKTEVTKFIHSLREK